MVVGDMGSAVIVINVNICGRGCRSRSGKERGDWGLKASALGRVFCDVLDGHVVLYF